MILNTWTKEEQIEQRAWMYQQLLRCAREEALAMARKSAADEEAKEKAWRDAHTCPHCLHCPPMKTETGDHYPGMTTRAT